jgi:hypothetical protein
VHWSDLYIKLCHQRRDEDKIKFTLEVNPKNLDISCMFKNTTLFVGTSLWQCHEELVKTTSRPKSG